MDRLRCFECGQFVKYESYWSWADIFGWMSIDDTIVKCGKCTEKTGPAKTNAKNNAISYQGIHNSSC